MNFPKWFLQIPKMSIDFTCFMNNNKKSRQLVVKIRDIITISNYCVVSKQEVHEEDLRMLCLATWFFSSFYVVKRVTDGLPRENQNCSSCCWKRHHFCSKFPAEGSKEKARNWGRSIKIWGWMFAVNCQLKINQEWMLNIAEIIE